MKRWIPQCKYGHFTETSAFMENAGPSSISFKTWLFSSVLAKNWLSWNFKPKNHASEGQLQQFNVLKLRSRIYHKCGCFMFQCAIARDRKAIADTKKSEFPKKTMQIQVTSKCKNHCRFESIHLISLPHKNMFFLLNCDVSMNR